MHRISTLPGGIDPDQSAGIVWVEQEAAPIIVLTAADTDIQTLSATLPLLPRDFPDLRVINLLHLQQQITIDAYAESVLSQAQIILLRLLGGRSYWSYGLEVIKQTVAQTGSHLLVLPGDDRPDWELISHSTVGLHVVNQFWQYCLEGGVINWSQGLQFLANSVLSYNYRVNPPQLLPRIGIYEPCLGKPFRQDPSCSETPLDQLLAWPAAGILFYRAHVLAGNTAPIDVLCRALIERQIRPICLYTYGLQEPDLPVFLKEHWQGKIDIVLNTTSFSLARLDQASPDVTLWQQLDVTILQVILSGGSQQAWQASAQGLGCRDLAMNVVLPEVDGRVITRAISWKTLRERDANLQSDVVVYQPAPDRVAFVADLARNWIQLRRQPVSERRVALILANYPSRDGRLANGVGLDTPASCIKILQALATAGYTLAAIPADSDDLIRHLTAGVTNDPMGQGWRPVKQVLPAQIYQRFFARLPASVQADVCTRWGDPPTNAIPVSGIQLGHIFVGLQPSRGYDKDPSLSYHAPDLVPPHEYLAFYAWIRFEWDAHAIVHVGKHGNLEWLPGKGVALSANCFPEVVLGPLPHFYPFIVNDPGEGSQAKRRTQAVILDHLTPPLTRAELYGSLLQLEALVDEYAQAESLDPQRTQLIQTQILHLIQQESLSLPGRQKSGNQQFPETLTRLDAYLCELKEAQIRDGLHILGQVPQGKQAVDLLAALARYPGSGQLGLTQAIAQDWGLEIDPLTTDLGDRFLQDREVTAKGE